MSLTRLPETPKYNKQLPTKKNKKRRNSVKDIKPVAMESNYLLGSFMPDKQPMKSVINDTK